MAQVNKYNHSKIYKICSNLTNKYYIGSTTQTLAQRLSKHMMGYKQYIRNNERYITSYEIIKLGDSYITLIEECNFNNKSQLFKREGEVMKLNINNIVNIQIQGRTHAEWRVDNKEYIVEQYKHYYNDNKEHNIEYAHLYRLNNKEKISEQKKEYHINNREAIHDRKKQYYINNKQTFICECGSTMNNSAKQLHMKSTKHINLIQQLFNNELNHYNF